MLRNTFLFSLNNPVQGSIYRFETRIFYPLPFPKRTPFSLPRCAKYSIEAVTPPFCLHFCRFWIFFAFYLFFFSSSSFLPFYDQIFRFPFFVSILMFFRQSDIGRYSAPPYLYFHRIAGWINIYYLYRYQCCGTVPFCLGSGSGSGSQIFCPRFRFRLRFRFLPSKFKLFFL